jgi:hypothetical protein
MRRMVEASPTLMDFRSLGLFYNFECFLIFKFNGLVLGSGWS